jgi:hypothetical protein
MDKIKMLPILQILTVIQGIVSFLIGAVLSFANPAALDNFLKFLQGYWPIYLMQVVPALIGSPLNKLAEKQQGDS